MTVKPEVALSFDRYIDEQLGSLPEYISSSYEDRLKKMRKYDKKRRPYWKRFENETPEQREKRLKYQREKRLKYHREWVKKKSDNFKSIKI